MLTFEFFLFYSLNKHQQWQVNVFLAFSGNFFGIFLYTLILQFSHFPLFLNFRKSRVSPTKSKPMCLLSRFYIFIEWKRWIVTKIVCFWAILWKILGNISILPFVIFFQISHNHVHNILVNFENNRKSKSWRPCPSTVGYGTSTVKHRKMIIFLCHIS